MRVICRAIRHHTAACTCLWNSPRICSKRPRPTTQRSSSHNQQANPPLRRRPIEALLSLAEAETPAGPPSNDVLWEPDKSKDGSVAIVVSGADKRLEILRGGILIGRSPCPLADTDTSLPEALYVKLQPLKENPSGLEHSADGRFAAALLASPWPRCKSRPRSATSCRNSSSRARWSSPLPDR